MSAHAKLSASSSHRWLVCTAAPTMESAFPDERSEFAAEGTTAHELGERALLAGRDTSVIEGPYSKEMRDYVQRYVDYVRALGGDLLVEQRLSFANYVPEGFGTSDTVVLKDGRCILVDLKYGKGIKIDAEHNTQLMLYALGAYDAYDAIYGPITDLTLVIVQPRLDHVDEWSISAADLLAWGESIKPIARAAFDGPGEAKGGDHCQFCRARHTCRARAEINLAIARDEMGAWCPPGDHLSDDEMATLFPKLDGLVRWANDLQDYALSRAESGIKFPGLKLVAGRAVRRYADDEQVFAKFEQLGFDPDEFAPRKLVGITAAEALVGKKEFSTEFADLVIRPEGKPTLVPVSDKRPELLPSHHAAIEEMKNG